MNRTIRFVGFVSAVVFSVSVTAQAATIQEQTIEKKMAEQRQHLANTYNELQKINDSKWTELVKSSATEMRKKGLNSRAEAMEVFADPSMKPILMEQIQNRLNDTSQNGILFAACVLAEVFTLGYAPGSFCLTYNFYWNAMVIFLWIVTLDGEAAVNY